MADDGRSGEKQRVLIAGAGVAGLEAALALRDLADERVEVTLCDPAAEFVYRPFAVGEPYGTTRSFRYDLRQLSERSGAVLRRKMIVAADPSRQIALARDGEQISYDHLIVAPGVRTLWAVPGAVTYWGATDRGQLSELIADLRGGGLKHVVFTMPSPQGWVLPLYDLALLAATDLVPVGATRVSIVTPEGTPLEAFGVAAAEQVGELLAGCGIEFIANTHPIAFEGGRLHVATGRYIEADAVVSLPRVEGRRVDGIGHDREGFLSVDRHGAVIGQEHIYAAGDVCAFPLKQGGVASQQADTAAEMIAAAAGAPVEPRAFDPILRWVLWVNKEPHYLQGGPGRRHRDAAGLSKRSWEQGRNPQVVARYLTPLVDSVIARGTQNGNGSALARASMAS
jgi:sulfide:quinone oxidoreductase